MNRSVLIIPANLRDGTGGEGSWRRMTCVGSIDDYFRLNSFDGGECGVIS